MCARRVGRAGGGSTAAAAADALCAAVTTGSTCRGDGRDGRGLLITDALRVDAVSVLVSSIPCTSFTDTSTDAELEARLRAGHHLAVAKVARPVAAVFAHTLGTNVRGQ